MVFVHDPLGRFRYCHRHAREPLTPFACLAQVAVQAIELCLRRVEMVAILVPLAQTNCAEFENCVLNS